MLCGGKSRKRCYQAKQVNGASKASIKNKREERRPEDIEQGKEENKEGHIFLMSDRLTTFCD